MELLQRYLEGQSDRASDKYLRGRIEKVGARQWMLSQ